jgi:hypothetical protein
LTDAGHAISTKLKKHGKELIVNCLGIKKFGIVSKVLGEDELEPPLLLVGLLEGLDDILDEHLSLL